MAFNIWERWPWTSFQDLNLDWLMKAAKEALERATEASESVGTFDARITHNTSAIEAMSSPARVVVDDALHVTYNGSAVTGEDLLTMMRTHGDLPFVEYMSEVYMLDTVRYDRALRFSMCHTYDSPDHLVMRHITIPANSSGAAYSITNEQGGGSGGDSNTLVFTITDHTCDHAYAQLLEAWNEGKALIARIAPSYISQTSAMVFKETVQMSGGGTKDRFTVIDPAYLAGNRSSIYGRYVYNDDTVSYGYIHNTLVTIDTLLETAVIFNGPQPLTAAQQEQARQNIGISGTGGGTVPRVPISATSSAIPPLSPNTLYVFTGDAAALSITLATPANSDIENEYHFIFTSGSTPTTLTLPNTIRQPDGFTVEANHIYEVSILEDNMTAQGWAVTA